MGKHTSSAAFHQNHPPEPCAQLDPSDIAAAVRAIRAAVEANQHGCAGSYLYIADRADSNRHPVFVISDLRSVATEWIRVRFRWLVAYYAPRHPEYGRTFPDGSPYLQASIAGITEDVIQHLADLKRT